MVIPMENTDPKQWNNINTKTKWKKLNQTSGDQRVFWDNFKKADNWNAMKIFSEYIKRRELPNSYYELSTY